MKTYLTVLGSLFLILSVGKANIGLYITGGYFFSEEGVYFPDDGLLQLVNLGDDGISNPVEEGSWVGGDDILIDLDFGASDFASSGGFDMWEHGGASGILERFFDFPSAPDILDEGDKVEIRWWVDYTASDYHNGSTPLLGQSYGAGRVDVVVNDQNNTAWVIPNESVALSIYDPILSEDLSNPNGLQPTDGFTGLPEYQVVPEPAVTSLLFGFAAVCFVLGQRRK